MTPTVVHPVTTLRPPTVIEPADVERDFAGILALYRANEWSHAAQPELLRVAVSRAHLALVARTRDEVVGFVRTLCDGAFAVYIADILVLPDSTVRASADASSAR